MARIKQREQESAATLEDDEERDEAERQEKEEQEEAGRPPTEKEKKNRQLARRSYELIRSLQRCTDRVIPMLPLSRLCMVIGRDYMDNLVWSPVAINLVGEVLENYAVGVLKDSCLIAVNAREVTVTDQHFLLARRIRGERC